MTRAKVEVTPRGVAILIDADTDEIILAGITPAEAHLRAGRINEIHERHARGERLLPVYK